MGSLFKKPKIPEPPPPTPMPDPEDQASKMAIKADLLKARGRAGRASTVLSGGDTASSYSGSTLGIA